MIVTYLQNSGLLSREVQLKGDLKERISRDEKIKKKFDDEKEEVIPVLNLNSRTISEYNVEGHYRKDYDTEKNLDLFA